MERFREGAAIGGDYFGNYEGYLPSAPGRRYEECDIDTLGQSKRGSKRVLYSNDGLYFYTDGHYETIESFYQLIVNDQGTVDWIPLAED